MKQLLLRVPDDLHQRLAQQAAEQGRSANAIATAILEGAIGPPLDRRARLRARAAALGLLAPATTPIPAVSSDQRAAALATMRGLGPVLDEIIDEDRTRQ